MVGPKTHGLRVLRDMNKRDKKREKEAEYAKTDATIDLREPLRLQLDGGEVELHKGAEVTFYYNPRRTAGLITGRTFCTIFDYEGEVQISIRSDGHVTKHAIPVRTRPRVLVGA